MSVDDIKDVMNYYNLFFSFLLWSTLTSVVDSWTVTVERNVTVLELQPVNVTCSTDYTATAVSFIWTSRSRPRFKEFGQNLWIKRATTDVAGNYECTVETRSRQVKWAPMYLSVLYKPKWQRRAVRKFGAALGHRGQISCTVHANPPPQLFHWFDKTGANVSSSSSSSGNSSILTLSPVKQTDYGKYTCLASNTVGSSRFELSLLSPGVPDGPSQCILRDVANTTVIIMCYPGYNGGQHVSYVVYKAGPFVRTEEAAVRSVRDDNTVELHVSRLSPGVNYTLLVYAENSFGRSPTAFTLYAVTGGRPLPLSNKSNVSMSVVGGAIGGAVALLVIVVVIVIVICKRKRRQRLASNKHFCTAPMTYLTAEDSRSQSSGHSPDVQRYIERSTTPSAPVIGINLYHQPGESDVGYYENVAFTRASGSIDDCSVHFAGLRSQQHMEGQVQPSVAGHGALQASSVMGGYASLAADRDHYSQSQTTVPYSDQHSTKVDSASDQLTEFRPDVPWEFPREKLYIRQKIGEGSYGEVWRARVDGMLGRTGQQLVAVKMLRDDFTQDEFRCLKKELEIMKRLQPHPNIIALLGCCSKTKPLCVLMELAVNGSLQRLLRQQRNDSDVNDDVSVLSQRHVTLTSSDLVLFAVHVAAGMEYVASQGLLHRDLAARNILLDEQLTCKICDFGSARDIIEMRQYESKTQRRLPIRWMAPESLMFSEYSTKSDVWSFGVLLWESVTLASTPYPGLSGPEVMEFVRQGRRMRKPTHCTDELYAVMMKCWHKSVSKRPTFTVIKQQLTGIYEQQSVNLVTVDEMVDNTFDIISSQPGEKC